MILNADMHIHSIHSADAFNTIEDMCISAIDKGLKTICFTEHIDCNPNDFGYKFFKPYKFIDEVEYVKEKYKDKIKVLKGIEFGEPHLYPKEFEEIKKLNFDAVIASIHWIDDYFVGDEGILNKYSVPQIWERYSQLLLETIEFGGFDIIAHLDFPKRYLGINNSINWDPILKKLIAKKFALEINTSTFRKGLKESMPNFNIIDRYIELGGKKLCMGSDAHSLNEVGYGFEKLEKKLNSDVLKLIGEFDNRKFCYNMLQ